MELKRETVCARAQADLVIWPFCQRTRPNEGLTSGKKEILKNTTQGVESSDWLRR